MDVSTGFDGGHRYRKNMVYRSLRQSSTQIVSTIKKKLTDVERSVQNRRAFRPLNESLSPSRLQQANIIAPALLLQQNLNSTPNKEMLVGYEFDNESNILHTPRTPAPRSARKKLGAITRLRQIANIPPSKNSNRTGESPTGARLSKQMARVRIAEIQSPRKPLLERATSEVKGRRTIADNMVRRVSSIKKKFQ
ncbi:unnamed protein product [Nippostrongylus brasiliensis]|uniref:Uncharacterized protein n=1 Tax=Nippostrongylus brasiliensis TaxID=27835 RepID=A0A158R2I7_NIPBR|nr:unnamed protein product [Nippostrongylus brasiliensis]